jgi:hypothetical protein
LVKDPSGKTNIIRRFPYPARINASISCGVPQHGADLQASTHNSHVHSFSGNLQSTSLSQAAIPAVTNPSVTMCIVYWKCHVVYKSIGYIAICNTI